MRHARAEDLGDLAGLLAALRRLPGLTERSPGIFYRKGRAFLHFHHDPKGLFADLRTAEGDTFDRIAVTDPAGQARLLSTAKARLG